ncbi:hypothetical protein QUA56_30730 [Microcoleus sp. N3A4]|uniref:hypothetical protein n=1 Tax=Microcoleus sp. N3A4 TaxID=3055379 RepID=UPI002FD1CA4B
MPLERFSEYLVRQLLPRRRACRQRAGRCEVVDRDRPESEKIGFWGDAFLLCKY